MKLSDLRKKASKGVEIDRRPLCSTEGCRNRVDIVGFCCDDCLNNGVKVGTPKRPLDFLIDASNNTQATINEMAGRAQLELFEKSVHDRERVVAEMINEGVRKWREKRGVK